MNMMKCLVAALAVAHVASAADLPSGYIRLSSIASTGAEYIKTGVVPNGAVPQIEMTFRYLPNQPSEMGGYAFGYWDDVAQKGTAIGYESSGCRYRVWDKATWAGKPDTDWHTVMLNASGGATVDGKVVGADIDGVKDMSTCEYYVFARGRDNYSGSVTLDNVAVELKGLSIRMDGTLERDFVPAMRRSDGRCGLYDLVYQKMYFNDSGKGAFSCNYEDVSIPADMIRRLRYVESTGTQYIDTGVVPNGRVPVVKMSYAMLEPENEKYAFGYWSDTLGTGTAIGLSNNQIRYRVVGNAHWHGVADNKKHVIEMNAPAGTRIDRAVVAPELSGVRDTESVLSYGLFGRARTSGNPDKARVRIYSFSLALDGTVVLDLVPAKLRNGAVGLWDQRTGRFYRSKGSELVAGPVAPGLVFALY